MPETKEKTVRWRETKQSEPSGFNRVRHQMVRVVEGETLPEGAVKTDEQPHDWKIQEEA